jgi:hypothetical protein
LHDPDYDENDVELLEKEIDQIIRCGTAKNKNQVPNDNLGPFGLEQKQSKPRTAAHGKRPLPAGKRRRII